MLVLDLFSGTGSSTQAFEDAGDRVVKVELDTRHVADYHYDVGLLSVKDLRQMCGGMTPDFVWASPPCTAFSIASIGHHWGGGNKAYVPKSKRARESLVLVRHVRTLLETLGSPYWVIENPLGMLRKVGLLDGLPHRLITYCAYGDDRQKRTDLWGPLPETWVPRPVCKAGRRATKLRHAEARLGRKAGKEQLIGRVYRMRLGNLSGRQYLTADKQRARFPAHP